MRQAVEGVDALAGLLLDPATPEAAWALGDGAQEACEALYAAAAVSAEHAAFRRAGCRLEWNASVKDLPLETLLAEWRLASGRWWLSRMSGQKAVRTRLATAAVKLPKDPAQDLETLIAMRAKEESSPHSPRSWHRSSAGAGAACRPSSDARRIGQARRCGARRDGCLRDGPCRSSSPSATMSVGC